MKGSSLTAQDFANRLQEAAIGSKISTATQLRRVMKAAGFDISVKAHWYGERIPNGGAIAAAMNNGSG